MGEDGQKSDKRNGKSIYITSAAAEYHDSILRGVGQNQLHKLDIKGRKSEIDRMLSEVVASQIHMVVNSKALFLNALKLYEEACALYYVKNGTRTPFSLENAFRMFCRFFDARGRLVTDVMYDDEILGNVFVEAFYLELVKIGSERTFRNVLLNILANNGQKETELYARIFNDKITRGQRK